MQTQTKQGFTLIELLVVVLIIGILAAVALPQYQVAVEKARSASLFPLIRAIDNAQQTYYLANGVYATEISALDLDVPAGANCWVYNINGVGRSLTCKTPQGPSLEKYYSINFIYCWHNKDEKLRKICKALTNECKPSSSDKYCIIPFGN